MFDLFKQAVAAFGPEIIAPTCLFAACVLLAALPRVFESLMDLLRYIIGLSYAFCVFLFVLVLNACSKNKEGKLKEETNTFEQIVQTVLPRKEKRREKKSENGSTDKTSSCDTPPKRLSVAERVFSWLKQSIRNP